MEHENKNFEVSLRILGNEVIAFSFHGGLASKTFMRGLIAMVILLSAVILFGDELKGLIV